MPLHTDDILFANATVIDGSGSSRYKANVVVRDGRIRSILRNEDGSISDDNGAADTSVRVIDCEDGRWVLSPGFIDMHAHSDLSLLHTPSHEAKVPELHPRSKADMVLTCSRSLKVVLRKSLVRTASPIVL